MAQARNTLKQGGATAGPRAKGAKARAGEGAASRPAPGAGGKAGRESAGKARHLAEIHARAERLSTALDALERARAALEDSLSRAAAGNLARAKSALDTLRRLSESGPLVDVRRLERELSVLVDGAGDLRKRDARGRKRDLLAVDEYLGDAAARLELAATPATGAHLELLSERLAALEGVRQKHRAAIGARFSARIGNARKVLGALSEAGGRLDGRALEGVARELGSATKLCARLPVGRLDGRPGDLYGIDGLAKRLDRRMSRLRAVLESGKGRPAR